MCAFLFSSLKWQVVCVCATGFRGRCAPRAVRWFMTRNMARVCWRAYWPLVCDADKRKIENRPSFFFCGEGQVRTARAPHITGTFKTVDLGSFFLCPQLIKNGTVPEHDVLVTNPPFSGDHVPKILSFCAHQGAKPWFLLLPNYVYLKVPVRTHERARANHPPPTPTMPRGPANGVFRTRSLSFGLSRVAS